MKKESIELKSVTFYQSVRIDGVEVTTLLKESAGNRRLQMVYCEDKIFLRNPDWKSKHFVNTVIAVGLHNVRHLVMDKECFTGGEFKEIFKVVKKQKEEPKKATPTQKTAPTVKATGKAGAASLVDDPSFDDREEDDKKILLKQELKRFRIAFDNRWGVDKLLKTFQDNRK